MELIDDALFFSYCEKRHRDNVVRFLRDVTKFKSAMLQPLGGRTASSILAEEIVSQYINPKGPNCVSSLSPSLRSATLERWSQIGKDYSRLQRTFFDSCRAEVERGELAELVVDFKAFQVRLEQESVALKNKPGDTENTGTRSMLGSMLSSIRKSTEPRISKSVDKSAEKSLDKSASDKGLDKSSSAERSGSLPAASTTTTTEKELPLSVHVTVSESSIAKLQVDLVAAATFLSWVVERSWTEFKELYANLKRYKVWVPVLPKSMDGPKLETWLEEVLRVAQLSASREVYAFLKIGNTVDLLAQAARTKRSTIAVLKPAAEEGDDLAALSSDDLAKALDNLALLEEPAPFEARPELPHVKSDGSVRARKVAEGGSDVSAEDIAAALRHLLNLQFTDSPLKTVEEEQLERQMEQLEEDEETTNDREEETTEAETTSAPNTFDSYPLDTSGGALVNARQKIVESDDFGGNSNNTADFDWRAIVADQKKTIEALQRHIRELEAELAAARRNAK